MPLYDYQCRTCSKVTEVRHGFREAYDAPCPECGGQLGRVFNPAGIVFKGSGFYVNDSRKPAAESASGPSGADSSASPKSSTGTGASTTPAAGGASPPAKTESKSESSAA